MMKSIATLFAMAAIMMAGNTRAQDASPGPAIGAILTPSVSPTAWAPPFITGARRDVTLSTGTLGRQQAIITYPYAYKTPLRLKNDLRTFLHKIPAGSPGFDLGEFSLTRGPQRDAVGTEHVMCFFRMEQAQPYAVPECLRYLDMLGVKWASAMASDNIPTQMALGDPIWGTPDAETGVAIPHEFNFQLVFHAWTKKSLRLYWMSEGRAVAAVDVPLKDDGTAVIETGTGTITLTRVSGDASLNVDYLPKPDAPRPSSPSPAGSGPKTVIVDGVVYTSGG